MPTYQTYATLFVFILLLSACGVEDLTPPDHPEHLQVEAIDNPFEALPDESTYAIRVASLNRASKDADAFLMKTLGMTVSEVVEDYLLRGGDLIDRTGLNPDLPLWGVEFTTPEGARGLVGMYPMEDQGLFLTRHGARIVREGVYRYGSRLIFLQHRYAIIAREPMEESVEAWLSDSSALAQLLTVSPPDSAAVWTRNQELLQAYSEDLVIALTQNLDGPALLIGAPIIMAAMNWLDELFTQTEYAMLALDANEDAAILRKRVPAHPDTALAAMFAEHRAAAPRLSAPPLANRAVWQGYFNLDPGLLEDARQRVLADLAIFGIENEPIDEFWEEMRQAWDGSLINAIDLGGEPTWLLGIRDEEAARRFIDRCVDALPAWFNPLLDMQEISLETRHDAHAGEYSGVSYGRIILRFLTHDPEEVLPDAYARAPSEFQYAFTPTGLLLTTGDAAPALDALNATGEHWPGEEVLTNFMLFEIDLINLLEAVKRNLIERAAIINPLATLNIPSIETTPVHLQAGTEADEFVSTLTIPADALKAVLELFLGGGAWSLESLDSSQPIPDTGTM